MTLAASLRIKNRVLYEVALILGGSFMLALLSQVAIPLPYTPVPITGQTLGILVIGAALGSLRGALCVATYIVEGALGIPVFASLASGPAHLLGPTAGYLWSFIPCAFLVGLAAEKGLDRSFLKAWPIFFVGHTVIFLGGVFWLSFFVGGFKQAVLLGFVPFIPGEIVKTTLASVLLPSAWKLRNNLQS